LENQGFYLLWRLSTDKKRDSLAAVSLVREGFISFHSPFGLRSETKGLSHGLKIARQLSIFAPVCGLVPPFQVRFCFD